MSALWAGYEDDVGLDPDHVPTDEEIEAIPDDRSPNWFWERVRQTANLVVWRHIQAEQAPHSATLKAAKALTPGDSKLRIVSNGRGIPELLEWLQSAGLGSPSNTNTYINIDELPYLLTPQEVAGLLRTTVGAIYARVERGQMPGLVRQGRKLLFHRDAVRRVLDRLGSGKGGAK